MKYSFLVCIILCLLLTACEIPGLSPSDILATTTEATAPETTVTEAVTIPTETPTIVTTEPTTLPETEPVTEPTQTLETTMPEESLSIPGIAVEDVIRWYNEVVLDAEYVHGGDATLVQKWAEPICYRIEGTPTQEDLQLLDRFCRQLNQIPGFPGIREAVDIFESNLAIYFCPQAEFANNLGTGYEGMDGGVRFWYDGMNQIYDGTICISTDTDQYVRNSVLQEELYNGLGPVQDTWLRDDSMIYAGYSTPQELTQVDWLILKLLYHPDMLCGMDAAQCEAVIRDLYD